MLLTTMPEAKLCVFLLICALILIYSCHKYYTDKVTFIKGMWSNEDAGIYILISDNKKNGRYGAYIVKKDLDSNEPFEIDIGIGMGDTMRWKVYNTDALPKESDVVASLPKGTLTITDSKKKTLVLYKDNVVSADVGSS